MWFLFQYVLSYTYKNITNHDNNPILIYMLKVCSIVMVTFRYEYNKYLMGVWIWYTSFNRHAYCDLSHSVTEDIILFFIRVVVFHLVGLS